jgi:TonB-linked outer membrane protein, SusC/RagA family
MDVKTNTKRLVMLCIFGITFMLSFAQSHAISGTVTDTGGETMIGVSVMEKGTSNGTITNFDGKFNLSVGNNAILVFTYVGFASQEIAVGNKSVVDVVLKEDATGLDELVVIGYGAVRKKDLTGSISTLKSDALVQVPTANVADAIVGRMAGVRVTTSDGSPDAEIMIRVRGGGSITQTSAPLYVVDGFPVGSFSEIPAGDIEDITVLKDASSTSIYGAQGANGVILITTKKPQAGRTQVSYNGFMQSKRLSKRMDAMNPYEYVKFNYEWAAIGGTSDLTSFQRKFGHYHDMDLYLSQRGTDWQSDMFGNDVISQQHNISLSGGNEKTKYLLSGTYNSDGGLMPYTDYSRYNLNFKLTQEIAKNLTFNMTTRVTDTKTNGDGSSGGSDKVRTFDAVVRGPVQGLQGMAELSPSDFATEEEYEQWQKDNMTFADRQREQRRVRNNRTFAYDASLDWQIIKGLTYRLEGGYTYGFNEDKRYRGKTTTDAANNGGLPMVIWRKTDTAKWRLLNMLTYNFTVAQNHKFNIMAAQEVNTSGSNNNLITARGFGVDLPFEKIFANLELAQFGSTAESDVSEPSHEASFFGRIGYNFGERYLATLTMRADGSSRFAPGNQWGYFPSAALAWRVAEESFMASTKEWLSDLKLRVSYGEAGNNRIDPSQFILTYDPSTSGNYPLGDNQQSHYVGNSRLPNPDIQWETMISQNAGIDFGVFNQLIWGNVEFYKNSSQDLILEQRVSAPGYTYMMANVGQITNKGLEVTLNGQILRKKNFTLEANFNIGFNKSNVDALGDGYLPFSTGWASTDLRGLNEYEIHVGKPVGTIYGWITDGYYTTNDFESYNETDKKYILKDGVPTNSLATGRVNNRPGAIKFKDISGPNGEPDGFVDDYDRTVIGDANPAFQGGFGLSGSVLKSFDYAINFAFVYGNDIYNANKAIMTQQYRTNWPNLLNIMNSDNRYTYIANDGSVITDLATLAAMNEGANAKEYWSPLSFGNSNAVVHSWLIEDGSFLRLQNLTLGYTIPQKLTNKFGCSRLRAYCTLNNLWVWTNYSGYDPEVSSSGRNNTPKQLIPGLDYSSYPKSFSFTFGLNVTF